MVKFETLYYGSFVMLTNRGKVHSTKPFSLSLTTSLTSSLDQPSKTPKTIYLGRFIHFTIGNKSVKRLYIQLAV